MSDEREAILLELGRSPELAHAVLFKRNHPSPAPPFHLAMVRRWHSSLPRVLTLAFRGAAKSTLAEESLLIEACLQHAHNILIIGESETRAVERLRAIKHEVETNEAIQYLFDIGPGSTWTDARAVLSNGAMLQAYGRGQSLRGVKHLNQRPDLIFCDDLEDEESVRTPEARVKTLTWFVSTVMPAGDPSARMRMAATPLDQQALAPTLSRTTGWVTDTFPVYSLSPTTGEPIPTWPERYPLEFVERERKAFAEVGMEDRFMQEYMMQATNPATRTFTEDMIRVEPHVRSYHAVYAMYDPARTTHSKSATTGKVVWSWVGSKLIIWDACARKWMPDEIVDDIFKVDDEFSPVAIGVEETGLNEFLLQPIRQRAALLGHAVPVRALHAPKGKLDFIRALQPFFKAGEVVFARDLPDLRGQLLAFPTGAIDAPNALAYALKMRPGQPIYEGFGAEHLADDLVPLKHTPLWLAVNATTTVTAAALCQVHDGRLRVFADWLREGDAGSTLADIIREAGLAAGQSFKLICPPERFTAYDLTGLRGAAARIPAELRKGGPGLTGREELRSMLRTRAHGFPALRVNSSSRWTARALAGGYCRSIERGQVTDQPEANAYSVLMEALEAFAGLLRSVEARDDSDVNYAYNGQGRRYISARG